MWQVWYWTKILNTNAFTGFPIPNQSNRRANAQGYFHLLYILTKNSLLLASGITTGRLSNKKDFVYPFSSISANGPILTGEAAYFNGKAHFCHTSTSRCNNYDPKGDYWPAAADLDTKRQFGGFALVPTEY